MKDHHLLLLETEPSHCQFVGQAGHFLPTQASSGRACWQGDTALILCPTDRAR